MSALHLNYGPLRDPLIAGQANTGCRAVVIIPARNEESILARTLDALRGQRDPNGNLLDRDSYEVLLLLNNCTDSSAAIAAKYQAEYPSFRLHVSSVELAPDEAFVGTARRILMDTAYSRLTSIAAANLMQRAILSTDADSVVAPDWIAQNLAALDSGADAVGGVIHLFPEDLEALAEIHPAVHSAYQHDRTLQKLVAELESILDPDQADPWPRHLEHFGASLACTPEIYAKAGGLPPARSLEDVAFVNVLRKVGARIRHCPKTHIYTSARMDGRAEIGLSGQLRLWKDESDRKLPHIVDSAAWMKHRFTSMAELPKLHQQERITSIEAYPEHWRARLTHLFSEELPLPEFLEQLDCDALIEEQFLLLGKPRHADIHEVITDLNHMLEQTRS